MIRPTRESVHDNITLGKPIELPLEAGETPLKALSLYGSSYIDTASKNGQTEVTFNLGSLEVVVKLMKGSSFDTSTVGKPIELPLEANETPLQALLHFGSKYIEDARKNGKSEVTFDLGSLIATVRIRK